METGIQNKGNSYSLYRFSIEIYKICGHIIKKIQSLLDWNQFNAELCTASTQSLSCFRSLFRMWHIQWWGIIRIYNNFWGYIGWQVWVCANTWTILRTLLTPLNPSTLSDPLALPTPLTLPTLPTPVTPTAATAAMRQKIYAKMLKIYAGFFGHARTSHFYL